MRFVSSVKKSTKNDVIIYLRQIWCLTMLLVSRQKFYFPPLLIRRQKTSSCTSFRMRYLWSKERIPESEVRENNASRVTCDWLHATRTAQFSLLARKNHMCITCPLMHNEFACRYRMKQTLLMRQLRSHAWRTTCMKIFLVQGAWFSHPHSLFHSLSLRPVILSFLNWTLMTTAAYQ